MATKRSPLGSCARVSAVALFALFPLLSPASTSTVQQPSPPSAVADPQAPASAPSAVDPDAPAPGEPDCHGPLYYRLKADGEKRKQQDGIKQQIMSFTFDVQDILERQRDLEYKSLLEEKLASSGKCASSKMLPSFVCTAYGKHDLEACFALTRGFDSIICRVALAMENGRAAAFPPAGTGALKEKFRTDDMAVDLLLNTAQTGHMECPTDAPARLAPLCQFAADAVERGASGPDTPEEARMLAQWALALHSRDPESCAALPTKEHAEFCTAFLAKDPSLCKMRRPLNDVVDRDWSCRSTLLATRLHPLKQGSEVILTVGSPYVGTGTCVVRVVTEYGGTQNRRNVQSLTLKTHDVREVRIPLSGEKFIRAESECQWSDPQWSAR